MNDIYFQYYDSDIKSNRPLGWLSLEYWIKSMINPKPKYEEIFNAIANAKTKIEKDELKRHLYFFTPCVVVNSIRRYNNIRNFTGLVSIDFDGLTPEYAIEFKNYIFYEYDFIICCWISASKKGVRALIKIPIAADVVEFKQYYNAIEKKLGIYNGFDIATKNAVLPMFMSYDKEILIRNNYNTWTEKYIEPEPIKYTQYIVSDNLDTVSKIIHSAISKITSNGHPQLRATAFALGGYIGAGYLNEQDAINIINNCIELSPYLSRRNNGLNMADVYKKTAKEMINKGVANPLFIKD